ncbi:uncharacterized protein LOC106865518 [Brachypodium distachyon]|uniref:uncharacterized protein LOC106865518 n=1 Tax=Brachypodium distachyon TaxID=15368 RepID=UPI00071CC449|nr:uncharacterized protein LOC106865518 [Brachypodium distachyon]|eukprot:XP_014751148.1 uncharacterized protein LOC106865518 [Brachypodium distachyon]
MAHPLVPSYYRIPLFRCNLAGPEDQPRLLNPPPPSTSQDQLRPPCPAASLSRPRPPYPPPPHPQHQVLDPVTLDLKASNYSKWHNFLLITVTQYGLADHLDAVPPPAADDEWQRMDSIVLRWLYGSISPEITDMVMAATTAAADVLTRITALFRDNQQARAGYLSQKFRNIVQGDKTITAYCLEQKMIADALADVGASVTDDALVGNIIKGLDEKYEDVGNLVPLLKPFPSFLEFRNMLLL